MTMSSWRLTRRLRVCFLTGLGVLLVCGPAGHRSLWHDRGQASHQVRTLAQAGLRASDARQRSATVSSDLPCSPTEESSRVTADGPAAVIILAAGEGTRMRTETPKMLNQVCGRAMLGHVVAATRQLAPQRLI